MIYQWFLVERGVSHQLLGKIIFKYGAKPSGECPTPKDLCELGDAGEVYQLYLDQYKYNRSLEVRINQLASRAEAGSMTTERGREASPVISEQREIMHEQREIMHGQREIMHEQREILREQREEIMCEQREIIRDQREEIHQLKLKLAELSARV